MKKIPLRKCVATNEKLPKNELLRIVKNNEGRVFVDLSGKANGRGAYLKKSEEALEMAIKKGSLNRALECTVSEEVYIEIRKVISE